MTPSLRSATLALSVLVGSTVWVVGLSPVSPAIAGCAGSTEHDDAVGSHEDPTNNRFGNFSSVWVNNFDNHQYNTWRATGVLRGSNNFAEVGWYTSESAGNQQAHPYHSWVNDGVPHPVNHPGINLTPRDDYHSFKVVDSDGDKKWEFFYDGNPLGSEEEVNMTAGDPLNQSERSCTTDSLWAHFNSLKSVRSSGGAFQDWAQLNLYIEVTHGVDYLWCYDSSTSFHVKQSCW